MNMLRTIKRRTMAASRARKLEHFYSLASERETVLDVGVSSEFLPGPAERNYFLKHHRGAPENYTGLAVQDMRGMAEKFPGRRFVQYPGGRFPFADGQFDWSFSNAVIEHVGDDQAQALFLSEMLRVSRRVFFTTPAKEFPIETHTLVPALHWWDSAFFRWCATHRPHYTPSTLRLFTRDRLAELMAASGARHEIHVGRLLGLPMTYSVVAER